jgi:pimeloyl-ACP methyl ester carboxylesterase
VRGVDEPTVEAALAAVTEELSIDPSRIGWAGHSAGGAYAIELSYLEARPVAGVFAMAAPFRSIGALGNPDWTPPLRMFYGTLDQNYLSALPLYEPQWQALGVPYELDIREGLGHNSLDTDAIEEGFRFLAAQRFPAASCRATATAPCLLDGRFRVEVDWATADGGTGVAATVAGGTSADSALMWFFQPENWELLVKVLDGCAINGHVWVFAAAATNVEWTLRVTDTVTERTETWTNPLGVRSPALTATAAFGCGD